MKGQESNFLINKSVFNYKSTYKDVDVKIIPSGKLLTKDKNFELTLDVRVTKKDEHDEELVRIVCSAIFEFDDEVKDKESISSYFLVYAPVIAFPLCSIVYCVIDSSVRKAGVTIAYF